MLVLNGADIRHWTIADLIDPIATAMVGVSRPSRTSDAQRTIYRSLGVASQDLAAEDFIVARAIERKCGVEVAWH